MSKYIPYTAQVREYEQQQLRRANGLKTGEYVKYPDPEKGPYIILAKKAELIRQLEAAAAATAVIEENKDLLVKLED